MEEPEKGHRLKLNSFAQHRNSSPTSIYNTIDQFSKGALGIIHEIALLQSPNRILRDQNDMLSKRRRAKKIRLRQEGSMTLAEGQDIQNQKDVEFQIHMETHYGSGRKRRT